MDANEVRVSRDDWPEECKRLHRQGFSIKTLKVADDNVTLIATVEQRTESRVEQPDTHGGASREVLS